MIWFLLKIRNPTTATPIAIGINDAGCDPSLSYTYENAEEISQLIAEPDSSIPRAPPPPAPSAPHMPPFLRFQLLHILLAPLNPL